MNTNSTYSYYFKGLFLLFIVLFAKNSFSQNPCAGKKYPILYYFYDAQQKQGYQFQDCQSSPPPPTITFNDNGVIRQAFINKWQVGSVVKFCYPDLTDGCFVDGNQLSSCIDNSYNEWTSLCPSNVISAQKVDAGTGAECCIRIQYSNAENDFNQLGDVRTVHASAYWRTQVNTGFIQCEGINASDRTKISINHTGKYLAGRIQVYPCPPPSSCSTAGRRTVNLCRILKHEIGHIFGLDHLENNWPDCGNSFVGDVMHGNANPSNGCDNPPLSTWDKCYFCAVYCPTECTFTTSVGMNNMSGIDCSIIPNPAKTGVSINFNTSSFIPKTFTIINSLGQTVGSYKANECQMNSTSYSLYLPYLSSGAYLVRIDNNDSYFHKRLIISK